MLQGARPQSWASRSTLCIDGQKHEAIPSRFLIHGGHPQVQDYRSVAAGPAKRSANGQQGRHKQGTGKIDRITAEAEMEESKNVAVHDGTGNPTLQRQPCADKTRANSHGPTHTGTETPRTTRPSQRQAFVKPRELAFAAKQECEDRKRKRIVNADSPEDNPHHKRSRIKAAPQAAALAAERKTASPQTRTSKISG